MKTFTKATRPILGLSLMAFLILSSCSTKKDEVIEDEEEKCPAPMAWLAEAPIPEPNYQEFPCGYTVDADGVTNSAFHEISWQYFLWLTESVKVDGKDILRFETMYNDASINLPADDKNAKTHILGGIQQAESFGIVVDNNGRAMYTSMIINKNYHDFVVDNNLNDPDALRAFPANTDFANGSMSMKASWKILADGEKAPEGAYTREAELYTVVNIDGNLTTSDNYADPAKHETITERVALVGFHIAVVVKDHPEFIWASFEHDDNAPNFIAANDSLPTDSSSMENFTFYDAGTQYKNSNVGNAGVLSVDPTTQVITQPYVASKTQVFRRHQYGGGSETNQNNIARLNGVVRDALKGNDFAQHYHSIGAVWFDIDKGHLTPNWSLTVDPTLQTGSLTLSNSVIETFTQDPNQPNSCFSCHNTMNVSVLDKVGIEGKNVLTSHILIKNFMHAIEENQKVINVVRN